MSSQELDISRHRELFDPSTFTAPIHVIGAGATGSWVVLQLAKLGLQDITVWDFDRVEEHNIPNQAFGVQDVGVLKVNALQDMVHYITGTVIKKHAERVTNQRLSGVVFMMVDSMAARKEIWENCIKLKSRVLHLIEPRMGLDMGRIYNVTPCDLLHIKQYEDTYYGDDVTEVSACGNSLTVITSALSVASMCVRQLINYADGTGLDNEILVDFKYNNFVCTQWKVKVEKVDVPTTTTPHTLANTRQRISDILAAGGTVPITHIAEPPATELRTQDGQVLGNFPTDTLDAARDENGSDMDRYAAILSDVTTPNHLVIQMQNADTFTDALALFDAYDAERDNIPVTNDVSVMVSDVQRYDNLMENGNLPSTIRSSMVDADSYAEALDLYDNYVDNQNARQDAAREEEMIGRDAD